MRKSISSSSLSSSSSYKSAPSPAPRMHVSTSAHNLMSHSSSYTALDSTEVVAEAIARTALPSIGICTELYGFPNEILEKTKNTGDAHILNQYLGCLMEPAEPVAPDELKVEICADAECNASRMLRDPERFARLYSVERRRRRRWSVA